MNKEILEDHIIYGEWDGVLDYQFMVYTKGEKYLVFLFGGCDYGGGIDSYFYIDKKTFLEIEENNTYDYELKEALKEWHKNNQKPRPTLTVHQIPS